MDVGEGTQIVGYLEGGGVSSAPEKTPDVTPAMEWRIAMAVRAIPGGEGVGQKRQVYDTPFRLSPIITHGGTWPRLPHVGREKGGPQETLFQCCFNVGLASATLANIKAALDECPQTTP